METEEVMVKKKRTKKVALPVVPHTLSPTEADVSVRQNPAVTCLYNAAKLFIVVGWSLVLLCCTVVHIPAVQLTEGRHALLCPAA